MELEPFHKASTRTKLIFLMMFAVLVVSSYFSAGR